MDIRLFPFADDSRCPCGESPSSGARGVDEVACLIDFGPPTDQALDGLTPLYQGRLSSLPAARSR
jgi:hypothetical protein